MIRYLITVILLLQAGESVGQAEIVKLDRLQKIIHSGSDLQVVNFWATWCAPCVKEMSLFEKLNREQKEVKVTLVSMDMDLDPDSEKVQKFIHRKKILSRVLILNERNPNSWIDKIDKNWSGSLPATLIVNGLTGKRKFIEGELHDGELEKFIEEVK